MITVETNEYVAKTFYGLENVLAGELKELGANDIRLANRAVYFKGDKELLYKANFHLRTALSVLKPVVTFRAKNEDDLYKKVKETDWTGIFNVKQTFAIETTIYSEIFKHSQYAGLKTKDAIVDQFRNKVNRRPFVDKDNPDILLNLHISEDFCTISLNSSGEPLFKRGYRLGTHEAPLNEALAAGLVLLSEWNADKPFIDFMCGSGTILIEAALIAKKIPPGIYRKYYSFENWSDFDSELYTKIIDYDNEIKLTNDLRIIGNDGSSKAIGVAKKNIKSAFLQNVIEVNISDFQKFAPNLNSGTIIINPPYGERIKSENITELYKNIGNILKQNYKGFEAWILSSNLESMKFIGLHPSKKITILNGALKCTFNKYEIYEGTKKLRKKQEIV
jgi:putative N6-adenine-specific DNA methylase